MDSPAILAASLAYEDSLSQVYQLVVGPVDNNVYTIRCKATGQSLLIDAANEHDKLLELCSKLNVCSVLETHGHWDHIQAVPQVREAGINVGITKQDSDMLDSYDFIIEDDSLVPIGDLRLHTIHTPGHTPGSMCFFLESANILSSGYTLFPGGPGATKFPGGDFKSIIASIEDKLFARLRQDTLVLPGHGLSTTIGNEMPHLNEWVARGW
jgi:glyoxylase-like metal-dependent hydrolase (beta-lactamase superfamily II)